jgi:hypothetical protein
MEKRIERYLIEAVERQGGLCVKFPPLFFSGFPDRLVLLPGGKIIFVETKAQGKHPSALQRRVHDRLRGLGFRVEVIDSAEGVKALL